MRLSHLISIVVLAGLMIGVTITGGGASSHREAPLIASDPQADNTDLYAWVDPSDPSKLNIVAVYYPFELPPGFPNGYTFGDQVLYTINIDRDGDGVADLRYGFRFKTTIRNPNTFYSNVTLAEDLKITSPWDPDLNIVQQYDVALTKNAALPVPGLFGRSTILSGAYTSPNNVGPTIHGGMPFADIMAQAVYAVPNQGLFWAGQVDDPFFADLGALWDRATLRTITGDNGGAGIDALANMNAQAIAIQLPISLVANAPNGLTGPDDPHAAVGIWAANYRPAISVSLPALNNRGETAPFATLTPMVQVSRLGMPLSNEVIVLLSSKDRWNRTEPKSDAQFESFYLNSHLAVLLNALYGTPGATTNRNDLSTIFLTGIPGLNMVADASSAAVKSDMLRINLAIPTSSFPNGRTLSDDIVDIELSVVGLSDGTFSGLKTSGISDGVNANDVPFQSVFPYVGVPHDGYSYRPAP
jgi:hypothetical protein